MKTSVLRLASLVSALASVALANADTVLYGSNPAALPDVGASLAGEFGANPFVETAQTAYAVGGTGAVNLTFRFRSDTGSFLFSFGFYTITSSLSAIDVSTNAGKAQYAKQALAGATLVFDDRTSNPGSSVTVAANGGDNLGFFLIPDATLAAFNANPNDYPVNGTGSATLGGSAPFRFPLFSASDVNPGGFDQLLSFGGTSVQTGNAANLFAWEDLTRAPIGGNNSDGRFNDLIFTIEGNIAPTAAVPAPAAALSFALMALRRRKRA